MEGRGFNNSTSKRPPGLVTKIGKLASGREFNKMFLPSDGFHILTWIATGEY